MVLDFSVLKRITSEVLDRFDHRLLVNAAHLDGTVHAQACVRLRRPTGEETTLSLPASDLVVLDGDSTIENITARVADELFDALVGEHPALRRVTVSCTEGQSKGAVGERHGDPGR
jgi:6-pyruvoyl-tetrahydropterin synthase